MDGVNLSQKMVTTRMSHNCWGCGASYAAGNRMESVSWAIDGKIRQIYWCLCCLAFMSELPSEDLDYIAEGDMWEWDEYQTFRGAFNYEESLPASRDIS